MSCCMGFNYDLFLNFIEEIPRASLFLRFYKHLMFISMEPMLKPLIV